MCLGIINLLLFVYNIYTHTHTHIYMGGYQRYYYCYSFSIVMTSAGGKSSERNIQNVRALIIHLIATRRVIIIIII